MCNRDPKEGIQQLMFLLPREVGTYRGANIESDNKLAMVKLRQV